MHKICAATENGLQPLALSYGVTIWPKRFVPNINAICDRFQRDSSIRLQICKSKTVSFLSNIARVSLQKVHKHPNGAFFPKPGYEANCTTHKSGSTQCNLADDFTNTHILSLATDHIEHSNEEDLMAELAYAYNIFTELFQKLRIEQ